ncbi:hypothetical protein [Streptomyces xantholiticus]|uniref:Uncharacterized protein n=1 Tax=Streptomyces xantholiticus TaxID=68285 RepID=A0ABV1UVZ8_9ACTN
MTGNRSTHRMADGVRIPGTWRHAFMARQAGISLPGWRVAFRQASAISWVSQ